MKKEELMNLNDTQKRKLGELIALVEWGNDYLNDLKEIFREMTKEEVADFNNNNNYYCEINRSNDTRVKKDEVYLAYKAEADALKVKYSFNNITKEDYKISYSASAYSRQQAESIVKSILGLNKTGLKVAVSAASKTTKKGGKN